MHRRDFLSAAAAPLLSASRKNPACIVLRLTGGQSHIDTWDMKPDAPAEIRGPWRPIRTNVPGMQISELFPRMARCAERYAIIRSVHHGATTHEAAEAAMLPADLASHDRVATINMYGSVFEETTWDIHGWKPFGTLRCYSDVVAPAFDAAFTSLLESLRRRGVFESTLVVAMGEFGRTPKINPDGGRDHWPHCFSILMAGGGIRGGQVYGSSDRIGAEPRDNPVSPAMVAATIRQAIGITAPPEALRATAPVLPILGS
jgi:Protein of unknown function (DUF1501)